VDDLVKHGFAATCNPFGAKLNGSTWRPEHTRTLRQASSVVVIADKDETRRCHARVVASALRDVLRSVKVIELPDKGTVRVKDSHDFFNAGGTANELKAIIDAAPEFASTSKPKSAKSRAAGSKYGNDRHADSEENNKNAGRKSAATELVQLAEDFAFFHDAQDRAFVRLQINGHIEVWPVESTKFRKLLAQMFYKRMGRTINRNALADGIATLAGRACHDAPEEPVFLRVAPHGEKILIDLCDPQWRVIEVTPNGWQILDESAVAFIRTGSMQPLSEPGREGSIDPLWKLLNVTPAQHPLVVGALLNYFHPDGPYFVLNFVGEQGTAKSCAARIVRQLIDPSETALRSPPREERDLIAQAGANWCVAFDNLSSLPPWLSDALCRLSTGGGHSARALYTDLEEISLTVKRPVILNGIEDVATRPDLAERALQIELDTIPDRQRICEKELWRKFEAARPLILSALLDGVACALRESPNIILDSLPRMADPALWATAGEPALGLTQGTFMTAYSQNLHEGAIASVEAHPIGVVIRVLLEQSGEFSGEPTELLEALNECASEELRRAKNWPQNARSLSVCLRRLAPALRRAEIEVESAKAKRRHIRLYRRGNFASPASPDNAAEEASDANDAKFQPSHDKNNPASPELVEEFI
jgi:hypothetical protein